MLQSDDSCYVDLKQYHLASFSTRNSTLNTSLRKPIRIQDFIQLCDSKRNPSLGVCNTLIQEFHAEDATAVKNVLRTDQTSFQQLFPDCICAGHTHQLQFASFSLPCERRLKGSLEDNDSRDLIDFATIHASMKCLLVGRKSVQKLVRLLWVEKRH